MVPLKESPFSYHFLVLGLFGSWLIDTRDRFYLNAFTAYRMMVTAMELYGLYGLSVDLYFVMTYWDMKKMTWNLCVTTLLFGTMFKNAEMLYRHETIDGLRLRLHLDAESRQTPEDISIHDKAVKELKVLRVSFYGGAVIFIPTWIITRYVGYFHGVKELPIPFNVPHVFDLDNVFHFHFVYLSLGIAAIFVMVITMESELAMYGLLVQISREYKVLVKDIHKINKMYHNGDEDDLGHSLAHSKTGKKEVNPLLKEHNTKMMLRKFCRRQATLIQYTEAFESCFNKSLLLQFFGMSVLIVFLALQCLWESNLDLSGNLLYQMGYLYINIMDMFLMCLYSTRLRNQCLEVGETFYLSTLWYRMGAEVQRDIALMIMRSQHPPRITTGKFMELSLNAFMNTMSNLYSWLALFRQLDQTSPPST